MVWVSILVVFALAGAIRRFVVVRRGREIDELARRGVAIEGVVVRKYSTAGAREAGTKRIGFRYVGPNGRHYDRFVSIADLDWRALERGHAIPLVMLPDRPAVSAPAWLVHSPQAVHAGQEA